MLKRKPRHRPVRADELANLDLLRLGSSTNYALVADAALVDGRILFIP